jgi:hypothetical protein
MILALMELVGYKFLIAYCVLRNFLPYAIRNTQYSSSQRPQSLITSTLPLIFGLLILGCTQPMDGKTMTENLITAAEQGDAATVLRLLEAGANINGQDERGRTPVMAATHGQHAETVKVLLEAGADVNIRDKRLDNPFLYAGAEGLLDILKLTIDAGADPTLTNRFGGVAVIPASERGHVEVVRELLTRTKINVNHVNNLGWTALLEAIILSDGGPRHQEIVQLLIEHRADVNLPDKDGVTPLQHARQRDYTEIIRLLEQAEARER